MPDNQERIFQQDTADGLLEVWQKGSERYLLINAVKQTAINIDRPAQLVSPLYHAFFASLLFIDAPNRVLLAGLGGGALARYLHYIMPEIHGDAVEINNAVADVATKYFYFPATQWEVNVCDIRLWHGNDYDIIIADIAEQDLTPAWLSSVKMLSHLKYQLSASGVLVINLLVTDAQSFKSALASVRKVFNGYTLCLGVKDHKNIVVLAFNQRPRYSSKSSLLPRVQKLSELWQLDFAFLLDRLVEDNPEGSGVF